MKLAHKFIKHHQHLNHELELETWNSKITCRHWVLWWVHKLGNMTIKRSHTRITYRKIVSHNKHFKSSNTRAYFWGSSELNFQSLLSKLLETKFVETKVGTKFHRNSKNNFYTIPFKAYYVMFWITHVCTLYIIENSTYQICTYMPI